MALAMAGFTLGIRPVESLRPHEEVIPRHVEQLASQMSREGIQRDPIIIDRETATVLDGMHRLAAFQEMKVENAVCCAVDYSSPAVSVGRWARVYALREGESTAGALAEVGGLRKVPLAEALSALERRVAGMAVMTSDAAYLAGGGPSHEEAVAPVLAMDRLAATRGWERSFVPEDEFDVPLQRPGTLVALLRRITKEDVVAAARSGKLLPCKSSMHSIDPRPVAVNFPLGELGEATTAGLAARLGGKGRLVQAGSLYRGRRYKERLLALDLE
jgi:hypothetical protein